MNRATLTLALNPLLEDVQLKELIVKKYKANKRGDMALNVMGNIFCFFLLALFSFLGYAILSQGTAGAIEIHRIEISSLTLSIILMGVPSAAIIVISMLGRKVFFYEREFENLSKSKIKELGLPADYANQVRFLDHTPILEFVLPQIMIDDIYPKLNLASWEVPQDIKILSVDYQLNKALVQVLPENIKKTLSFEEIRDQYKTWTK